jgi:hypothetical protein
MQGDFDRVTFDPVASFASVLLQQGRLLLPADFNEQSAILHHFLRNLIIDIKGRAWRAGNGFKITPEHESTLKMTIDEGHFYVDGILCDNEVKRPYENQPFFPKPDHLATDEKEGVVYLDCWERHVTWLNYARLRDPALGGPDTATRVQIAWQVRTRLKGLVTELDDIFNALSMQQKAAPKDKKAFQTRIDHIEELTKALDDPKKLDDKLAAQVLEALDEARPRMAADAKQESAHLDPSAIAADAEYRGRENQLYRVEIHRPGLAADPKATASFKWS